MTKGRTRVVVLALAGATLLAACGEEPVASSGRSMSAPAEPAQPAKARAENSPPRIRSVSIVPSQPLPGVEVQAQVSVDDPDGDVTHLRFAWSADGEPIAGGRGASLRLPDFVKGTRIEVEVVASDGVEDSAPATARAEVDNSAPKITGVRFEPAEGIRAGTPVVAVVDSEDADGDPVEIRYQWLVNGRVLERGGDGPTLDTTGLKRGDTIAVRVVAEDGDDESDGWPTPSLALANSAPKITSTPPAGMAEPGTYRYALEASDPDGDRSLRFRLASGPPGARVDPVLGEFVWSPGFEQAGAHAIEVTVSDGHGGEATQRFEVKVQEIVEAASTPPAKQQP
jgi:hypothetical protein